MTSSSTSCLLYLNSSHATKKDATQGKFKFTFGPNTVYTNKAVRVVPTSINVPNIFPNITSYNNTMFIAGNGTFNLTVPVGQYDLTSLFALINPVTAGVGCTFGVNSNGYVTVTSGANGLTLTTASDILNILGLHDEAYVDEFTGITLNIGATTTLTATNLPNLGGEKIVFISSDRISPGNCVFGEDGLQYDMFAAVSLAETAFGQTALHRAHDAIVADVEYSHENSLNTMVVELYDSRFRPLPFPDNYELQMVFKVYHTD